MADLQHGLIATEQLAALGLTASSISRLAASGRFARVHRRVYLVGRSRLTRRAQLLAAALAVGDGAVVSHRSALELWLALPASAGPAHVTAPGHRRKRREVVVHQTTSLAPSDRCALDYIPLTAPARSLLDLAASGQPDELEPGFSRSEAERRMLRLIREASLPGPRRNVRIGGWEVDLLWPEQRLIAEVDGYAFHSGRRSFERDRRKQTELQELGYEVLRFTWRQVTRQPLWVAARLAGRLAARRP